MHPGQLIMDAFCSYYKDVKDKIDRNKIFVNKWLGPWGVRKIRFYYIFNFVYKAHPKGSVPDIPIFSERW